MSPSQQPTTAAVTMVVTAVRPAGGHDVVSLVPREAHVSDAWAAARPGQLVVLPGSPARGQVLPEVHWLGGVRTDPLHGTSVELVLPVDRETAAGERLTLLGPLGRGFAPPTEAVPVLVVAEGPGVVAARWLLELLRERGCQAHLVLGVDDPDSGLDPAHLRRHARGVLLCPPSDLTSAAERALDDPAVDPAVVYAATSVDVARRLGAAAGARGVVVRVSALDLGGEVVCGTGLCGGCDLVVDDGRGTRRLRPCLDGPVVPGEWLS